MKQLTATQTSPLVWPNLSVKRPYLALLIILLILIFILSLTLGSVSIPPADILAVLFGGEASKETWTTIILKFRLPKAITAVLAGAALGVSGLQMQTMFRNPLAGPYVLGINAGASLGVALVVLASGAMGATLVSGLSFLGGFAVVVAATLGATAVLLLVLLVARRVETMTLLILGLMFGYFTSALVSILLYYSSAERIQAYVAWTFGDFGGVTWRQLSVMAPAILVGLLIALGSVKPLNALLLGETYARSLGLTINRARFWLILSTAVLAGTVTAFVGPIGFIGLAVPHLCRALFHTADHRTLVPATILMGGIVALAADLIAHLPGQQATLPLNAVTALIGAPVVIWVILRQRNLRASFNGR